MVTKLSPVAAGFGHEDCFIQAVENWKRKRKREVPIYAFAASGLGLKAGPGCNAECLSQSWGSKAETVCSSFLPQT